MLFSEPFPHVVLDDVFPEPFYRRLLDEWPIHVTIEHGAESIVLTRDGADTGSELPAIWAEARAALIEGAGAIAESLGQINAAVLSELLIERVRAYILAPHVDDLRYRVSVLLYLAEDDSRRHLGTTLYRHAAGAAAEIQPYEPGKINVARYAHQTGAETEAAKLIEFVPNRMLVMLNGPTHWHGQHLVEDYRRKTYNAFLG